MVYVINKKNQKIKAHNTLFCDLVISVQGSQFLY